MLAAGPLWNCFLYSLHVCKAVDPDLLAHVVLQASFQTGRIKLQVVQLNMVYPAGSATAAWHAALPYVVGVQQRVLDSMPSASASVSSTHLSMSA